MRWIVFACFFLATTSWAAEIPTTTIKGMTYSTGYLPGLKKSDDRFVQMKVRRDLPERYDSREEGFATRTKNQGNCGSCWSFARTKAFEAALIKAGVESVDSLDLAEQDTLVNDRYSHACRGGYMDGRFEVNYGQTTEDQCPYRASGWFGCRGEKFEKASRWAMVGGNNQRPSVDELRQAIYDYGVLAVTVSANNSFSPDNEGRITTCGGGRINHMVTLAGYRPAADGGYEFLIGNSWGESWGNGGYAWSKQGCNKLASVAGDAALFFYFE